MRWLKLLLSALLLAGIAAGSRAATYSPRDGDLVFNAAPSPQGAAIQSATRSPYSHVGLVLFKNHKPYVFEAAERVLFTPLDRWLDSCDGGRYAVKRLKNADVVLTARALRKLKAQAGKFDGRPYDDRFAWSDDRLYCSELVWKVFDQALGIQVGRLERFRDYDYSDPQVQAQVQERFGDGLPADAAIISPAAIFQSDLLVTVLENPGGEAKSAGMESRPAVARF